MKTKIHRKGTSRGLLRPSTLVLVVLIIMAVSWYSFFNRKGIEEAEASPVISATIEARNRLYVVQREIELQTKQMAMAIELKIAETENQRLVTDLLPTIKTASDVIAETYSLSSSLGEKVIEKSHQFDTVVIPQNAKDLGPVLSTEVNLVHVENEGVDPALRARNPILYMDEKTFRTMPLDKMLEMYSNPSGKSSCDSDFGIKLVNRWRDTATECCSPENKSGKNQTKLTCHLVKQTRHHGSGDQLL
jgi:hypothetical protein